MRVRYDCVNNVWRCKLKHISERERLLHKPESSADDRDLMIGARIMYNEEDLVRVDELATLSAIRIIELLHTLQPKIISPSKYHDTISIENVEDRQPSRMLKYIAGWVAKTESRLHDRYSAARMKREEERGPPCLRP